MGKPRRKFSSETKRQAVDAYVSGAKSAAQVAAELEIGVNMLYRWRVEFSEEAKGLELEELRALPEAELNRIIQRQRAELDEYKKLLAEKTVIEDLLKKRLRSKTSQQWSELTGLIETFERAAQKRRRSK